ncbi:MAG: ROK family protein [Armatimonadota bacterium]|nr:ROK family protein [Armatimonadota bacterium]MDR7447920.1 ROK family protein [Armatimonadota bacterium]MDR7458183.1 ROK family protein [Armatimonadota bacterium]MDR7478511.1 ROK family protein [Armatimonadota bacterium]MDR7487678.1 ROK family protein [Armatimonadota bacterium]
MAARAALAVDIGGTRTRVGVVGGDGRVLAHRTLPTPTGGPDAVVAAVAGAAAHVLAEAAVTREALVGVAAGAPGPLDPRSGVVFEPPNLVGWRDVPLRALLEERLGLPAAVENDANAAALGEAWVGAGRGVTDLVYITVSTGVGGGLILGGELYSGVSGTAGEVGHMTVALDGPPCFCGQPGHLEGLASGRAIARAAREALARGEATSLRELPPEELSARTVAEAARAGDPVARAIYERAGTALGAAVASLVNLLNPPLIILGGGVMQAGDLIMAPLWRAARERAFARPLEAVRLVPAALGEEAGLVGAAAVAFRRLPPPLPGG